MRMEVSGVFNSCETLLTKSVFCCASNISRRTSRPMNDPPATMAAMSRITMKKNAHCSVRAARLNCCGSNEVERGLPVGQDFADFRGDEGMFPVGGEALPRECDGMPGIVENGHANVVVTFRREGRPSARQLLSVHRLFKCFHQSVLVELRAEDDGRVGAGMKPDEQPHFVLEETCEFAARLRADDAAEIGFLRHGVGKRRGIAREYLLRHDVARDLAEDRGRRGLAFIRGGHTIRDEWR